MAAEPPRVTTTTATHGIATKQEKRHRSIFDVPANFFDYSQLLYSSGLSNVSALDTSNYNSAVETLDESELEHNERNRSGNAAVAPRWTCNTCEAEFDSLEDQRSHFKSVKLSIAGKSTVKEEDFDELTSDSFKDYDVSSISGSEEDEPEKGFGPLKFSMAEKDAKKKARAKELKKLRKEKEKKAQEELKRAQAAEREKRAAAAERRRAAAAAEALSAQGNSSSTAPSIAQPKSGVAGELNCSCCNVSLAGKVPFHRYNYKYCSTSCMHVHREFLEDE